MKFGYTILYVDDVAATIAFYTRAFGLSGKVLAPDEYGELSTGTTKLAFAAKRHVKELFPIPFQSSGLDQPPPPFEIGLVVDEVEPAFDRALSAGATKVIAPAKKPWGQTVGYVRDNNGFLIEICTPLAD
jgi:catechol 2,3-dioxygenase-like lactoylglutathione lyase family enzyme